MTPPPRIRLDGPDTSIRPLSLKDVDEYAKLVVENRFHTAPWDPIRPDFFYSRAGQQDQLRRDEDAWTHDAGFAFAVLDRTAGDRIVGRVALGNVVRGSWQNATLGYWVAADAARRGHGTMAVQLVLRFAFEDAELHRVQPAIIPRNVASTALARRCGFRHEGTALRYLQIGGIWEDHDLYAMTIEDWRAGPASSGTA